MNQKHNLIDSQFRSIADNTPVQMWLSGPDNACVYLNKEWESYTGRNLEEMMDAGWESNLHPDDLQKCKEISAPFVERQEPFEIEFRLKRHDGEYRYFKCIGAPRYSPGGTFEGYSGCCMDVHDKHELNEILEEKVTQRTEALRQQIVFSQKVIDASVDIMIVYDRDLNFLMLNDAAFGLYKLPRETVGRNLFDVYPQVRNSPGHDDVMRALKGETIHNSVYKSAVSEIWFEDFIIPLHDKSNEIYGVLVIARDITERVLQEEELKSINHNLIDRNAKLQSSNEDLASFNYVASHDLQEPLRKVSIFASRIIENDKDKLSAQSLQYFDRINSALTRMQNLIMALLDYSRTESTEVRRVKTNLNKTVKDAAASLEEVIKSKGATVEIGELPSLSVVQVQLTQLFQNLLSNSLKYAKADVAPKITVNASEVPVAERDGQLFWKISVSDNGIGFDMEYKQKIFELFQRLHGKTEIEGTGVGLAICRKIAHNHDGFITAESEMGKGSVFSLYLPSKNIVGIK